MREKKRRAIAFTIIVSVIILIAGVLHTGNPYYSISLTSFDYAESEDTWEQLADKYGIKEITMNDEEAVVCNKADIRMDSDIQSFAVSKDRIAIVFSDFTFGVFSGKMELISSFKLSAPGRTCGVLSHDNNYILFTDYSGYATEITEKGKFVCMYRIPEQYYREIDEWVMRSLHKYDGNKYSISDKESSIPKVTANIKGPYLIKVDENGEYDTLYDALEHHKKINRLMAAAVLGFLMICGIVAYLQYGRQRKEEKGEWVFKE